MEPTDDKPKPRPYEPPTVEPVGNVREMLAGDLGTVQDAGGPTTKQPTP